MTFHRLIALLSLSLGCVASASAQPATCSINANPSGGVLVETPVTLTAFCSPPLPPGTTYHWSTGQTTQTITVSPTATTAYSLAIALPSGNLVANLTITVTTIAPACSINATPSTSITQGTPVTLTVNCNPVPLGRTSYLWSTGDTTQSINAVPTSSTTYGVTIKFSPASNLQQSITISVSAALLAINTGNNQTGLPNANLAAPLSVKVSDGHGAMLAGIVVTWQSSEATDVLGSAVTMTDRNGIASNTLRLGPIAKPRKVTASISGGIRVVFTVNTPAPPAAILRQQKMSEPKEVRVPAGTP